MTQTAAGPLGKRMCRKRRGLVLPRHCHHGNNGTKTTTSLLAVGVLLACLEGSCLIDIESLIIEISWSRHKSGSHRK